MWSWILVTQGAKPLFTHCTYLLASLRKRFWPWRYGWGVEEIQGTGFGELGMFSCMLQHSRKTESQKLCLPNPAVQEVWGFKKMLVIETFFKAIIWRHIFGGYQLMQYRRMKQKDLWVSSRVSFFISAEADASNISGNVPLHIKSFFRHLYFVSHCSVLYNILNIQIDLSIF